MIKQLLENARSRHTCLRTGRTIPLFPLEAMLFNIYYLLVKNLQQICVIKLNHFSKLPFLKMCILTLYRLLTLVSEIFGQRPEVTFITGM